MLASWARCAARGVASREDDDHRPAGRVARVATLLTLIPDLPLAHDWEIQRGGLAFVGGYLHASLDSASTNVSAGVVPAVLCGLACVLKLGPESA